MGKVEIENFPLRILPPCACRTMAVGVIIIQCFYMHFASNNTLSSKQIAMGSIVEKQQG